MRLKTVLASPKTAPKGYLKHQNRKTKFWLKLYPVDQKTDLHFEAWDTAKTF